MLGLLKILVIFILIGAVIFGLFFFFNKKSGPLGQKTVPTSKKTESVSLSPKGESLNIKLEPQNSSGESGEANLSEFQGRAVVKLNLGGNPKGATRSAEILKGSCSKPGRLELLLTSVIKGQSVTTLNVNLDKLRTNLPLSIAVFKFPPITRNIVACGNITK